MKSFGPVGVAHGTEGRPVHCQCRVIEAVWGQVLPALTPPPKKRGFEDEIDLKILLNSRWRCLALIYCIISIGDLSSCIKYKRQNHVYQTTLNFKPEIKNHQFILISNVDTTTELSSLKKNILDWTMFNANHRPTMVSHPLWFEGLGQVAGVVVGVVYYNPRGAMRPIFNSHGWRPCCRLGLRRMHGELRPVVRVPALRRPCSPLPHCHQVSRKLHCGCHTCLCPMVNKVA